MDLKPCPFCNGTNVEVFQERIFIMNNAFLNGVICRDCGGAVIDIHEKCTIGEVKKRWNTRTENPFVIHPKRENEIPW